MMSVPVFRISRAIKYSSALLSAPTFLPLHVAIRLFLMGIAFIAHELQSFPHLHLPQYLPFLRFPASPLIIHSPLLSFSPGEEHAENRVVNPSDEDDEKIDPEQRAFPYPLPQSKWASARQWTLGRCLFLSLGCQGPTKQWGKSWLHAFGVQKPAVVQLPEEESEDLELSSSGS